LIEDKNSSGAFLYKKLPEIVQALKLNRRNEEWDFLIQQ